MLKVERLSVCRERLKIAAQEAWIDFLGRFADKYDSFRFVVRHLATLDCLLSLAEVATHQNYVKPNFGMLK